MKGAIADPLVKTISTLKQRITRMMGSSQNFFLTFINPQRSIKKSICYSSIFNFPDGFQFSQISQVLFSIWSFQILGHIGVIPFNKNSLLLFPFL